MIARGHTFLLRLALRTRLAVTGPLERRLDEVSRQHAQTPSHTATSAKVNALTTTGAVFVLDATFFLSSFFFFFVVSSTDVLDASLRSSVASSCEGRGVKVSGSRAFQPPRLYTTENRICGGSQGEATNTDSCSPFSICYISSAATPALKHTAGWHDGVAAQQDIMPQTYL